MNNPTFEIRKCTKENYEEFLSLISTAFQFEPFWFAKNTGHVTPFPQLASDTDMEKNYICFINGKAAGALGIYPVEWVLSYENIQQTFTFSGIGQVACLPEHRGKGVMSNLLKKAILEMEHNQQELSWLQGARIRYRNYGWDLGGRSLTFTLNLKELKKATQGSDSVQCRKAQVHDAEILNKMYVQYPSYIVRDQALWEKHLKRENITWDLFSRDNRQAYLFYKNESPDHIGELAGDLSLFSEMLCQHMEKHRLESITVSCPYSDFPVSKYFFEICTKYSTEIIGNIRINDPIKTFEKMKCFIIHQSKQMSQPADEASLSALSPEIKKEIVLRLLSHVDFLPDLKGFEYLRPVSFWLPIADDV